MNPLLQWIYSVISAAICLRVLTHSHDNKSRHTVLNGLCCWLLILSTGGITITTLFSQSKTTIHSFDVIVLLLFAIIFFRSKGTPAHLFGIKR